MDINKDQVREHIRKSYSKVATQKSSSCCGLGCSCVADVLNFTEQDIENVSKKIGYYNEDMNNMPEKANMGLGCGNPIAIASLKEGETVLDLGSGGGFDCFLSRKQVGETGIVIGVDMTHEMLKLSRANVKKLGYTNVEFRLGEIENLPVADSSVDVIISNCVINLSLEKDKVFKEAYRVLKNGGRLSISDVVATAKLPEDIRNDLSMMSGCIAGAEYVENIRNMLHETGFINIKLTPKDNSKEIISSWVPNKKVEDYVASYMIEAVK